MIIIGAGAIGVEFAYFYNAFGTKVTMIEMMPNLLPVEDTEVSQTLEKAFAEAGDQVFHQHQNDEDGSDGQRREDHDRRTRKVRSKRSKRRFAWSRSASRRCCRAAELKLDLTERGYIKTNERYETNVAGHVCGGRYYRAAAGSRMSRVTRRSRRSKGCLSRGIKPKKVDVFPGLHLLPAAGRERRPDGTGGEGKGGEVQGRQIPFSGEWQSAGGRGSGRLCEAASSASRTGSCSARISLARKRRS